MIFGLYADEAITKFAPGQWVNVYEVLPRGYLSEATMSSLPEEVLDDPEGYFLEPTDDDGNPMSLRRALAAAA
jgi:hypothetical protein